MHGTVLIYASAVSDIFSPHNRGDHNRGDHNRGIKNIFFTPQLYRLNPMRI